jgi:hypothetical protein
MEETLILLRFNCPDPSCDYVGITGWGDLKLHVRATHGRLMWCVPLILCNTLDLTEPQRPLYTIQESVFP